MNSHEQSRAYWNELAECYQRETRIACDDFHYGPLLPGDADLGLLPDQLDGQTCLELACGAAQNSVFLSKRGAACTAVDVSEAQLSTARGLAAAHDADIVFMQASIDALPFADSAQFRLVHTNSLGFSADPAELTRRATALLAPGGTFISATNHAAFAGEWLELDDEETGMFLTDYFHPPSDVRAAPEARGAVVCCRSYPPSEVCRWYREAGLVIDAVLEPPAQEGPAPYESPDWRDLAPQLRRFPFMTILRGTKPR